MVGSPRRIDITGKRYGMLVVLEFAHIKISPCGHKNAMWLCECDCGNKRVMYGSYIKNHHSPSCGCNKIAKATTHGMTNSPEYSVWRSMVRRCHDTDNISYPRYGGRGITVCERWRSFEAFFEDMGKRPSSKYSIDRIDNDGNYEPSNCRWATYFQQNNNTRFNRRITHAGETLTVSQWAGRIGIKVGTLWERLNSGWSIERALSEPLHNCGPRR